jgi:catechol 2,3-dioxygenase-like lactoylglutathione lyase family enzyme
MPIHLDHLAVAATDKQHSATFLTTLLGLPEPTAWGPFLSIQLDDGVHLDYAEPGVEFPGQHYALLVTDDVFDAALERIRTDGVPYSAGPGGPTGEINHNHGGRGVYFDDPDGHHFELITQPYGAPVGRSFRGDEVVPERALAPPGLSGARDRSRRPADDVPQSIPCGTPEVGRWPSASGDSERCLVDVSEAGLQLARR